MSLRGAYTRPKSGDDFCYYTTHKKSVLPFVKPITISSFVVFDKNNLQILTVI